MNTKMLKNGFYKINDIHLRTIEFNRYKYTNKNEYELIKKNEQYRNIHKGKRCFVIGNGPSLKDQDLSLLENEYVITVNQIARNKDFKKIKTNYHFWADPVFFNLAEDKPEDMELLKVFKSVNTENNTPECFLPVFAYEFVQKYGLDKHIRVNYFNPKLHFFENYTKEIDFTKFIPGFQTVVQSGIAFAIFMGFSEINLLGCDTTGIITTINTVLDQDKGDTYGYTVTQNELKRIKENATLNNMETVFAGWTKILQLYDYLYQYCQRRNIKLINCSGTTIIDSIPRRNYEETIMMNKKL